MKKNFRMNFLPCFFYALLGLSLYFLFYLPLEFLLTEIWLFTPKINPLISAAVLLFFLFIANLFNLKKIINERKKIIVLSVLFSIIFFFYGFYRYLKLEREYLPKIYQVKPSWVIQGQPLEIKGVNFGPTFKKGKVIVDSMEFLVRDWGEDKIIAEAPVPSKEGNFPLFIETEDGRVSNSLIFEIKDPDYLKKYLK